MLAFFLVVFEAIIHNVAVFVIPQKKWRFLEKNEHPHSRRMFRVPMFCQRLRRSILLKITGKLISRNIIDCLVQGKLQMYLSVQCGSLSKVSMLGRNCDNGVRLCISCLVQNEVVFQTPWLQLRYI